MKKVSLIIIGGGARGTIYSDHVHHIAQKAEVIGIAEPREFFRRRIAERHRIPPENQYADWHELLARGKIADAVVITTQDRMHIEPAVAFARLGYDILIEKPIAPDIAGCREVVAAAESNEIIMSVCHVLRYTEFTRKLKHMIEDGAVGTVMSVQHLEPVGHWRFAHSYVRGNWRKESESSSVLLAKSIHDLDWIRYIVGARCRKISSFGSLMYFKKENQPSGAADRCLECGIESDCPYSAPRFYLERIRNNRIGAYVEAVEGNPTEESMLKTLKTSPYGRCVFACDNDVADHQVVNMEFENGATAVFTLAGCSKYGNRRTTVFGSEGELFGDGDTLQYYSYRTGETRQIEIPPPPVPDHHGGGDFNLLNTFVDAIRTGDRSGIVTGPGISLETHLLVYAAETSRLENRIVNMADFLRNVHAEQLVREDYSDPRP